MYDRVVPCMSATAASKLGAELTAAMVADVLPGFAHSASAELAESWQRLLLDGHSFEDCRRVECVADVAAGRGCVASCFHLRSW